MALKIKIIMKKHSMKLITCFCLSLCNPLVALFSLGVENVSSSLMARIIPHKKNPVVALITNQTGVNQKNISTVQVLLKNNCCNIKYIFVPEHGLTGVSAERDVPDSVDQQTKIPILSLYGNGTGKMISADQMKEIDALIFDIQDSGMRHYTYISTLLQTMKIAAEHRTLFIVLDRPNPLGCLMQGPLVEPDLISFISIAPIPLRHGMTIGELAWYFNEHVLERATPLHVVTMTDYDRTQGFAGKWFHQLSPNIQSLQSCMGYSFLGLLGEVEPFDVGVGTDMAFRCMTLPETLHITASTWKQIKDIFSSYGIKSFLYKHSNPRTKKHTKGLRLEFSDINSMHSFELFIDILDWAKKNNISFSFSSAFDKAVGSRKVKDVVSGISSKDAFFKEINHELQQFQQKAQRSLFYSPRLLL
jgi:uncharacterized protein YbbC (DUF1343 family)